MKKLNEISRLAGMQESQMDRWKRLGFCHPDCHIDDFVNVGVLGLDHLLCFSKEAQLFSAQVLGQISLPPERRCPFALLSTEITETLSSYWQIGSGVSTIVDVNPLVLILEDVHCKFLETFCRLWKEMDASQEDMAKILRLLRKLIKSTLASNRSIEDLTASLKTLNYNMVKELQMKEVHEQDDDLLNQQSIL